MTDPYAGTSLSQTSPEARALEAADAQPVDMGAVVRRSDGTIAHTQHPDPADLTDGYHTMQELYDHRRALSAVLAAIGAQQGDAWRSTAHHPDDAPIYEGYFVVGIELPAGTISYHYAMRHWDEFSAVPVLEHAPKFDGHTSADVVDRLTAFTDLLTQVVKVQAAHLADLERAAAELAAKQEAAEKEFEEFTDQAAAKAADGDE